MSRRDFFEQEKRRKMVTTMFITVALSIVACVTIFVMYSQKLNNEAESSLLALENDDDIVANDDFEATSYSSDKGAQNKTTENTTIEVELDNTTANNPVTNTTVENKEPISAVVDDKKDKIENKISNETPKSETQVETTELSFQAPVAGEIIKDFAMETLVYSETLDEWCTHSGIDIKADKASVVMASEKGKVESIKNDPRYGLTIIISHENGFKTVYSNLLTTEFVKEGEEVEKGQTIATVGESASFEIADDSHLHFEMYQNGSVVNPTIYFK